jgi:drug/metabolite transporter (DMT)-like permease
MIDKQVLARTIAIAVFAVVLTSLVWTSVFIATGRRLPENVTTLVALAALGIGYFARRRLAARRSEEPDAGAGAAATANGQSARKRLKGTKRKGKDRERRA